MSYTFSGANARLGAAVAPVTAVPCTLACWVKRGATQSAVHSLVNIGVDTSADNRFALELNASNQVQAVTRTTAASQAVSSTTLTDTTGWHHVCAVFSAANSRAAFLDGSNKGTQTTSRVPAGINYTCCGTNPAQGGDATTETIAEVAIWNVALSDQDVALLATGIRPTAVQPGNLVAYWPLRADTDPEPEHSSGTGLSRLSSPTFASAGPTIIDLLAVANCGHGHTAGNIDLTQASTLSVANTAHAHAATSVSLASLWGTGLWAAGLWNSSLWARLQELSGVTLSVAGASHTHSVQNVSLTQQSQLVITGTSHAHAAQSPELSTVPLLTMASAAHAHTAGNIDLSQQFTLTVGAAGHAHSAANIGLSQQFTLTTANTSHAHAAGAPVLVPGRARVWAVGLWADGLWLQGLWADETTGDVLAVAGATHAHSASQLALTQASVLSVAAAAHAHIAANLTLSTGAAAGGPVVLYTDTTGGPTSGGENDAGAFLRIFGANFGTSGGLGTTTKVYIGSTEVAAYKLLDTAEGLPWLQQLAVQVGALGGQSGALPIKVQVSGVDSNTDCTFTPRAGRIYDATTSNWVSLMGSRQAGDHVVFRGGTYTGSFNSGWNNAMFQLESAGTASQPLVLTVYPGETARLQQTQGANSTRSIFHLGGESTLANYLHICNFRCDGKEDIVYGAGDTASDTHPESGAHDVRFVNCDCSLYDTTTNTMTGFVAYQGDNWKVLGNYFTDPINRDPINNNHVLYCQCGADNCENAYNWMNTCHVGHVIQHHQDGTPMQYDNIHTHDNLITSTDSQSCRGITVTNVSDTSTINIYNNILVNVGQSFSGLLVVQGIVKAYNNILWDIDADCIVIQGNFGSNSGCEVDIRNNIVKPKSSGSAYVSFDQGNDETNIVACNRNCFYGAGSPPSFATNSVNSDPLLVDPYGNDFDLGEDSPCLDAGDSAVSTIVTRDATGRTRPAGAAYDIGAMETPSGEVATSLVIAAALHAHAAQGLALTQANILAIATALHGHSAASLGLTQANILSTANIAHSHSATNISLNQANTLTANGTSHAHSAGSVSLTQANTLVTLAGAHAHSADVPALSLALILQAQNALHTQLAQSFALNQANTILVESPAHLHTALALDLVQGWLLATANVTHAHGATSIDLLQGNVLAIQGSRHSQAAANPVLVQAHVLSVNGALHAHAAQSTVVTELTLLEIAAALHAHAADALSLTQHNLLIVAATRHAHVVEAFDLAQANTLVVADALHAHLAGALGLAMGGAPYEHVVFMVEARGDRLLIVDSQFRDISVDFQFRELSP